MLVTTTYLEQLSADDLVPAKPPAEPVDIVRAEGPSPEFSRFLYSAVGGDWFWIDRLAWSRQRWREYLETPLVETWVAWSHGTPAGYIELAGVSTVDTTEVEIAYFGLLPGFLGRGIGGHLLSVGCQKAWDMASRWPGTPKVSRVWVHTCNMDGPAALTNYQARGFKPYRVTETEEDVPDSSPSFWAGVPAGQPRD